MPLVEVTYDRNVPDAELRRLADCLPDLVAHAVDCPDEPWTGPAEPGDIEIRFQAKSDYDVGDLPVVVEVRTKLFPSRVADEQRRADLIRNGLSDLGFEHIGVWLILAEGAWGPVLLDQDLTRPPPPADACAVPGTRPRTLHASGTPMRRLERIVRSSSRVVRRRCYACR